MSWTMLPYDECERCGSPTCEKGQRWCSECMCPDCYSLTETPGETCLACMEWKVAVILIADNFDERT